MAFCVKCGSQLAAGVRFCATCGTAVGGAQPAATGPVANPVAPVPPAAPAASPAPAPAQGSSVVVKILFAVLGVIVLFGLLSTATCFYIGYRARQKLHALEGGPVTPYHGKRQPCAFLSESEVSKATGMTVTSVSENGPVCEYRFGSDRTMAITYTWEGGAMLMGLTRAGMKQVAAGMDTFTDAKGIGDQAFIGPMGSSFMMRKGDVLVNFDLRISGVSVEAAGEMARTVASRLY